MRSAAPPNVNSVMPQISANPVNLRTDCPLSNGQSVGRPVVPVSNDRHAVLPRLVFAVVTDALLFLHVLAAFLLVSTVVMLSGVALGAAAPGRTISLANLFWDVGGLATLVFGIWLAIDIDG